MSGAIGASEKSLASVTYASHGRALFADFAQAQANKLVGTAAREDGLNCSHEDGGVCNYRPIFDV